MSAATGTNIELLVTENNSDSGPDGKQSTSLVNGLYLADSLAQLMKTEFNSFVWWDLRNGTDTSGDFSVLALRLAHQRRSRHRRQPEHALSDVLHLQAHARFRSAR